MKRYGVSLDIGKDLDDEEKREEKAKKILEESSKPVAPQKRPPRPALPKSDAPLPVTVGDDWIYLVGAVCVIAALIGLFVWSRSGPIAQDIPIAPQLEDASASDVGAVLNDMAGERLANQPAVPTANASNRTMNVSS